LGRNPSRVSLFAKIQKLRTWHNTSKMPQGQIWPMTVTIAF
jgi:hypothetical protein